MACKLREVITADIFSVADSKTVRSKELSQKISDRLNQKYREKVSKIMQYSGQGGYVVSPLRTGITKVVNKAIAANEKEKIQPDSDNVMFQKTTTKKSINTKLNSLAENYIKKIFGEDSIISIQEYNTRRKLNGQDEIDAAALVNLTKQIVAYNKSGIDGTSLSEEAWHIIVEAMWDSPEIQTIANHPDLKNTQVYSDNYISYMETYNQDELKTQKELVGKILAEYTYQKYNDKYTKRKTFVRLVSKISPPLARLFDKLLHIIKKRVGESNVSEDDIHESLKKALENEAVRFIEGKISFSKEQYDKLEQLKKETDEIISSRGSRLTRPREILANSIKELSKRKDALNNKLISAIDIMLNNKEVINNIVKKNKISGKNLKDIKDQIISLKQSKKLSLADEELNIISEILIANAKDLAVKKEIQSINSRLSQINKAIASKELEAGIYELIFGQLQLIDVNENEEESVQRAVRSKGVLEEINSQIDIISEIEKGEFVANDFERELLRQWNNLPQEDRDKFSKTPNRVTKLVEEGKAIFIANNKVEPVRGINKKVIGLDEYRRLQDAVLLYRELIKDTNAYIKTNDEALSTLSESSRKELLNEIDNLINKINYIDDFLTNQNNAVIKNKYNEYVLENPEAAKLRPELLESVENIKLLESTWFERYIYGAQVGKEPLWKILTKKVFDLKNDIYTETISDADAFMNEIQPLISKLRNKFGSVTEQMNKLSERDDQGNKTGYFLSEVKTYLWEKNMEEAFKQARKNSNKYSEQEFRLLTITSKKGTTTSAVDRATHQQLSQKYKNKVASWDSLKVIATNNKFSIPENKQLRHELWMNYSGESEYELYIKAIAKHYNKQKADWFSKNTTVIPNLNEKLLEWKNTLSETKYYNTMSKNVVNVTDEFGELLYTYHTGELVMPSQGQAKYSPFGKIKFNELTAQEQSKFLQEYKDAKTITYTRTNDYTNETYDKIQKETPELIELLNIIKNKINKGKNNIPTIHRNYSVNNLLPQITKSFSRGLLSSLDSGNFKKNLMATINDGLSDMFQEKDDEAVFANRMAGVIIKRPPVRYSKKLDDPNTLTDDLVGATIAYIAMTNNYKGVSKNIDEIQTIHDLISRASVVKDSLFSSNVQIKQGLSSELYKRVEDFINAQIYGEVNKQSSSEAVNVAGRVLKKLTQLSRGANLRFNIFSQLTGAIKSRKDLITLALTGRQVNINNINFAYKEYTKNIPHLISDFESPYKKNRISTIMKHLGYIDNINEVYTNTDRSRLSRIMHTMLGWGGYRLADVGLKTVSTIAVANNIRIIEGESYTYLTEHNYKQQLKKINDSQKKKEFEDKWNNSKTLYELIDVVYENNNGKVVFHPSVSKQAINYWRHSSEILISRADQQLSKIDRSGMDYSALASPTTLHTGWMRNTIERAAKSRDYNQFTEQEEVGFYVGSFKYLKSLSLAAFHMNRELISNNEADIESIRWVTANLASLFFTTLLAYIAMASIIKDDDDDYWSWFIGYLTTRLMLEDQSGLSINTVKEYIDNPVASMTSLRLLGLLGSFFSIVGAEQDLMQSGFYEGWDRTTASVLKGIPGAKGLYENYLGGTINSYLGLPGRLSDSVSAKNKFLRDQVVNKFSATNPLDMNVAIPRVLAVQLGKAMTNVDSKSAGALPTKSANK